MPSRRAVILGALSASASVRGFAQAQTPSAAGSESNAAPRTVLQLQSRSIEVNGKPASVYGIRQPDGTFGITTDVGKSFRVRVENKIDKPSLIHWHGLAPPWQQDGVPGVSGPPIPPGESADYDFPLRYGGTFWMHSHEGLQEQSLMVAPLIIHDGRDQTGLQEVAVMLGDFSFKPPEQIFEDLKKRSAMPQRAGASPQKASMTAMARSGAGAARDLNDVRYDAFLANYRTLTDPEVVKVEPGGEVLLRIINASSMTNFHIKLGRLQGRLTAVDGFAIVPQSGRRFPIADAQRLDIRLTLPRAPGAYPILAVVEGERRQTGIVLAAGRADIARIPDMTEQPSPALTLDFERSLRAAEPLRPRKPDRVHTINLTGEMMGYIWSINNIVWNKDVPPLPVAAGERVELIMINRTGMSHPMHLHGHQFQVVEIDGKRFSGAVRDTVLVPPGGRVVVVLDANNPGLWAFHCHLLYHLDAGMFTTLRYV
jgi:FtsP/CotA-like multicopper oxidase with cupredoxin domain